MLNIKPEIIDIILLDKRYKNKELEIDNLIIKIYNLYQEITEFKNIDFESLDIENIDVRKIGRLNFPFSDEELKKINELNSKYDENLISIILSIFAIVEEMKRVVEDLEKHRSENYDLLLMEHDINNTEKQINTLKTLLEKAKILDDKNDIYRIQFAIEMYEEFKKDKTKALARFHLLFMGIEMNKTFGLEKNEKMDKAIVNADYFFNIFCLINGYLLNSKKIYKSSALRIYNLINSNLNVNKKPLSDKVSHLFARLGIDINLDYRKAHNIRKISIYHDYTIYDYSTNKKDTDLYFSKDEIVNKMFEGLKPKLEKMNYPLNEVQMNKKAVYLSNIEAFQDNYKKTRYVID